MTIKEKIIGKTLQYNKKASETMLLFFNDIYKDNSAFLEYFLEYINSNINDIKMLIEESKIENLRTIRFVFDCFKVFFDEIEKEEVLKDLEIEKERKNEILFEILVYIALIANEYKSGKITSIKDLGQLNFDWYAVYQIEAQAFFESAGSGDPYDLDRDGDGIACESN
ncbi:excalibur calcium-binding domain-containing protein [Thermolongibacillus altinsuensis]